MMTNKFNEFCEEYFYWYMSKFPILASFNGLKKHDGELDDFSKDAMKSHYERQREWKHRLNGFRDEELSFDQQIDKELMNYYFENIRFYEEVFPIKYMKVDAASELSYSIFSVWTRDEDETYRFERISERIGQAEEFLNKWKSGNEKPVRRWVDLAIQSCDSCVAFIQQVCETAAKQSYHGLEELNNNAQKAFIALNSYKSYLKELYPRANTPFAMGHDAFEEYMKIRHIPYTGDELIELSFEYQHDIKAKIEQIKKQLNPDRPDKAMAEIRKDHPKDFETALRFCQDMMQSSKEYVENSGFATTSDVPLDVIETPEYMRQTKPFAALFPAGKFGNSKGIYVLTPPKDPANIKYFNRPDLVNTSIHEAYPGHHLQLARALSHPSLVRLIDPAIEFVEGWALYCEETTLDVGYEDTPERRYIMLCDLLWRAVRVQIDVQLSRGEIDYDRAVETLSDAIDQPLDAVRAEINRYTFNQGYQLSYLLGKHMIMEMREKYLRSLGFSLREFHDRMLSEGSLPLYLHKRILDRKLL